MQVFSIVLLKFTNGLLMSDWKKEHLAEDVSVSISDLTRAPTSGGD